MQMGQVDHGLTVLVCNYCTVGCVFRLHSEWGKRHPGQGASDQPRNHYSRSIRLKHFWFHVVHSFSVVYLCKFNLSCELHPKCLRHVMGRRSTVVIQSTFPACLASADYEYRTGSIFLDSLAQCLHVLFDALRKIPHRITCGQQRVMKRQPQGQTLQAKECDTLSVPQTSFGISLDEVGLGLPYQTKPGCCRDQFPVQQLAAGRVTCCHVLAGRAASWSVLSILSASTTSQACTSNKGPRHRSRSHSPSMGKHSHCAGSFCPGPGIISTKAVTRPGALNHMRSNFPTKEVAVAPPRVCSPVMDLLSFRGVEAFAQLKSHWYCRPDVMRVAPEKPPIQTH